MSDKNFIIVVGLIVAVIVGSFVFLGSDSENNAWIGEPLSVATGESTGELDSDGNAVPVQPADHVKGNPDATVTLIEFADFSCPACFGFFPELKELELLYPDQLQIVFRHNPLSSIHPNAFAAHRAAEAAGQQGMFWEMHDLLYSRQSNWARQTSGFDVAGAISTFEAYAGELGLDIDQYRTDVDGEDVFNYIGSHLDSGAQIGVTGTPTLFLNGELIEQRSAEDIGSLIDALLDESSSVETDAAKKDPATE